MDLSTSESAFKKQEQEPLADHVIAAQVSDNEYSASPHSKPMEMAAPKPRRMSIEPEQVVPKLNMTATPHLSPSRPAVPPKDSEMPPNGPQAVDQDWSVSGEIYRKKIEALREEVGNGWLSVLSEEAWDRKKNPSEEFSPASTIRPSPITTPRPGSQTSQTKIGNGRTLGGAEKPTVRKVESDDE